MTDQLSTTNLYERHQEMKDRLLDLLGQLTNLASGLHLNAYNDRLMTLTGRVESDTFRIMILGEFKRGKSTVINAMLGEAVLPAYAIPTTAIINEVVYAPTKSAILHPLEGEPVEIGIDELEDHVVIDDDDPDAENPFSHAVVRWPLPLLELGVSIVDSPGLNESPVREAVTLQYLGQADVVVFVIDAQAALSISEQNFLKTDVRALGHEDVFFLCNKINLVEEDQREKVMKVTKKKLANMAVRENHVYFIDARAALRGRREENSEELAASGLTAFENEVERFLADERGKLKLLVPARDAKFILRDVRNALKDRASFLETDLNELRSNFEQAQTPLKSLQANIARVDAVVSAHISETGRRVEERVGGFVNDLTNRIPSMVDGYKAENKMGLNPITSQDKAKALVEEVTEFLTAEIKTEFAEFQSEKINPIIEERLTDLEAEIEQDLQGFIDELDQVRLDLTKSVATDTEYEERSPFERMVAAVGGVMLLDPGSAITGARFGAKEMIKGLGVQIAVGLTGFLIGFGPAGLAVLLLLSALGRNTFKLGQATNEMKRKIGESVVDDLRTSSRTIASGARDEVERLFGEVRQAIVGGMEAELAAVQEHVQVVIAEKEEGEERVEQEQTSLRSLEQKADQVADGLDDFVADVAVLSL